MTTHRSIRIRLLSAAAAAAIALGGSLLAAQPAFAATFDVTSLADDGGGSTLRAQIANANGADGVDLVRITTPGTITLTGAPIVISDGVRIVNESGGVVTIARDGSFDMLDVILAGDVPASDRAITIEGIAFEGTGLPQVGHAVHVSDAAPVATGLTIVDSTFDDFDGAVSSAPILVDDLDGEVLITGSRFTGNDTTGDAGGAVLVQDADALRVTDSQFVDNSSQYAGGAIFAEPSVETVVIAGSTFDGNQSTNNRGGAINVGRDVTISDSTFTNNWADIAGGAIGSLAPISLTITGSSFSDNTSDVGGAIYLDVIDVGQHLTISGSQFSHNSAQVGDGGAIELETVEGRATVMTSEFDTNSALRGGTLHIGTLSGDVGIGSSTFADNTASTASGLLIDTTTGSGSVTILQSTFDEPDAALSFTQFGDEGDGSLELLGSTVVGEPALAIGSNDAAGSIIRSSILQSTAAPVVDIDGGLAIDAEWSIFSHDVDDLDVVDVVGNQIAVDPLLGALADNGGPTRTRLPEAGSPAIDAGDPAFAGPPTVDQRGTGFPRVLNDRVDIGAVESPAATEPAGPSLPPTGAELHGGVPLAAALALLLGALAITLRRRRSA